MARIKGQDCFQAFLYSFIAMVLTAALEFCIRPIREVITYRLRTIRKEIESDWPISDDKYVRCSDVGMEMR